MPDLQTQCPDALEIYRRFRIVGEKLFGAGHVLRLRHDIVQDILHMVNNAGVIIENTRTYAHGWRAVSLEICYLVLTGMALLPHCLPRFKDGFGVLLVESRKGGVRGIMDIIRETDLCGVGITVPARKEESGYTVSTVRAVKSTSDYLELSNGSYVHAVSTAEECRGISADAVFVDSGYPLEDLLVIGEVVAATNGSVFIYKRITFDD